MYFFFSFHHSKRLQVLDVSLNKLQSAKLGTQIQLPNLVSLNLALNDFTTLMKDDFLFLNNSSSLLVLNMSCVPLKKVRNLPRNRKGNIVVKTGTRDRK